MFTRRFDIGYYVILLNMPHQKAKDLLGNLQEQFKSHPYKKDGDPIALRFFAGIAEYTPGTNPALDTMENDDGLFDAMLAHVERNMDQAEKAGQDKIVASKWADEAKKTL